jgi:lysophospholipase L1-like esterase
MKQTMNKKTIVSIMLGLLIAIPALPQTMFNHPWQGKRVAYFGDSITDPKVKAGTEKWWTFLDKWLGITPYVYGISGRQWDDIPNQANKLKQEHGDDFDAIIIFIGTNDFNAAVPIGEWYTEKEEQVLAAVHKPKAIVTRKMRTPIMDKSTYRGRINIALSTLKAMFPTKQIVLITPIHRAYAEFSDKNIQPTEAYQNECGEYIDRYIQSVKEAANIWAVPVIDLNATSGLYPLLPEHLQYFHDAKTDQLHPNDAGYKRMAATLYYQLLTVPCTFDVK